MIFRKMVGMLTVQNSRDLFHRPHLEHDWFMSSIVALENDLMYSLPLIG